MWQLGLIHAVSEQALYGIIAGVSNVEQLQNLISWQQAH
jgi:hypothetical protein